MNPYTLQALRRKLPDREFYGDVGRNALGLPEAALTMGTGLAAQAGTGLGTLAGMAKQKLSGDRVNLDAATDTIGENAERFTFAPRSKAGKEALGGLGQVMEPLDRGMQAVGQKAADVTGSPAVGAGVYTALNVLDPELLAPGAAKIAALRGAQGVARDAARTAVPMGEALRSVPQGQRGAYTLEDLAGTEGDFSFQSPTLQAFGKLKPQEQGRVSGQQLMKALQREGAKKEELQWMGLDKVLGTNDLLEVADVRKIAETNQPEIDFATARSGGELDEDAISEKAYDLTMEDSDLEYPYAIKRDGEVIETVDNERDARSRVRELKESYVDDNLEGETDYYLENIEDHFDEDQLAEMDDAARQEWAEESARSSLQESANDMEYDIEPDYDAEPANLESLREYWEGQVRDNPGDYGIEGGGAPSYGEYTVGREGRNDEANYSVSAARLQREERYGKGGGEPDFLTPYMREPTPDAESGQASLFQTTNGQNVLVPESKAFRLEALRRQARDADPNAGKYKQQSSRSHYDELGDDQLYFARETDRPAPDWGSTQEGIGRTQTGFLKDQGGQVLEQEPSRSRPLRMLEEDQSDWLQAGRKTGWADPKDMAKLEKAGADEASRVRTFQEQALNELPVALANDTFGPYIADVLKRNAESRAQGQMPNHYDASIEEQLARYNAAHSENADMGTRMSASRNLFNEIYRAAESDSPLEREAVQIRDALDRLPTITRSPVSGVTPTAPMKETRQWMKLALADALRRAVVEGQQYLGFTKGDIHAKRWGSDSVQYAPGINPREMRWSYGSAQSPDPSMSYLDQQQALAETLLDDDNPQGKTFNLDDPKALDNLTDIVKQHLSYGMHDYPNPDAQMRKRAEALLKQWNEASAAAQGGERKASHYSPRAHGTTGSYDALEGDLMELLREAGSSAEIRDLEFPNTKPGEAIPGSLRGIEIDPALARAAKRGFRLPY